MRTDDAVPVRAIRRVDPTTEGYVSTGNLPAADVVRALVVEAHARFASNTEGACSQVYPALARAAPELFGISIAGTNGALYEAGDAVHPFAVMSVSKPFVFALVAEARGASSLRESIGANATGRAFDSIAAVEESADGRTNPMVNSGAIATTSFALGTTTHDRWEFLRQGLSRFAGRPLAMLDDVLRSARATNFKNRSLAVLLHARGRLAVSPEEAVDLYTQQCALAVTARDLAVMGATLADGGVNPITGERVVGRAVCEAALAMMTTSGMYETSGDWLFDVGLPGKSGIGGGIVAVSPGKGALGTFAPPLDAAGNSVRGQLASEFLSSRLGLTLFASAPDRTVRAARSP
jgi:glutaminase